MSLFSRTGPYYNYYDTNENIFLSKATVHWEDISTPR